MATEATTEKELREKLVQSATEAAERENASRTGKGTRKRVGQTRGRSVQVIDYEAFDESKPETLPTSVKEFMEVTKTTDEPTLVSYLISGYNDAKYTEASDPIAEFIDATWSADKQAQFRLVVRNFSKMLGVSIEDAANATLKQMKG